MPYANQVRAMRVLCVRRAHAVRVPCACQARACRQATAWPICACAPSASAYHSDEPKVYSGSGSGSGVGSRVRVGIRVRVRGRGRNRVKVRIKIGVGVGVRVSGQDQGWSDALQASAPLAPELSELPSSVTHSPSCRRRSSSVAGLTSCL